MKRSLVLWSVFCLPLFIASCGRVAVSPTLDIMGDWTHGSDLDGPARSSAFCFVASNMAYVGGGTSSNGAALNDLWSFDPARNAWTQRASLPGPARSGAAAFSVGGIGYVGTGLDDNGNRLNDFWQFDPSMNRWTRKADFGGTARSYAVGFATKTNGYIATGNDGAEQKDRWAYDPAADT